MREEQHRYDFCVVGGGMAGLTAALAAARHGARVALVQDRPVLGGNASSEIRMHICGAHGANLRETGILEELLLENLRYNGSANYSVWDALVLGVARAQPGIDLFLNTSVNQCEMDGPRIRSIRGWQLTTETWHRIEATLFADCSGDAILAPLSGAAFRLGREARAEYGESIAPEQADNCTMGMSCLFQPREHPAPQPFEAPAWANFYTKPEDLHGRGWDMGRTNFWWIEIGGDRGDILHGTEKYRDELLKIVFGVWNYIKNYAPDRAQYANWALDWVGFLPGKRESRRYLGDHVMTQRDIESAGHFDDLVAYGGWSMDDHFPAGFNHPKAGTIFHPAPSPFGICYRSLYSRNIDNLFCAGRCHSASHAAMSATRVMGTTAVMGQAVGTAAALALRAGVGPRGIAEKHVRALQQALLDDDAFLPWQTREVAAVSKAAQLTAATGDPEPLRNGVDRPVGDADNGWKSPTGAPVTYRLAAETELHEARLVFDSDLDRVDPMTGSRALNMRHRYPLHAPLRGVPATLVKAFRIETQRADGSWQVSAQVASNYQRLVRVPLAVRASGVRLVPLETWGAPMAHLFAFEVR
jgi:hypothetical protein